MCQKWHIQSQFKPNGNGSDDGSSQKPIRDITEWFTKKTVFVDVEYL